jgi:hypothetical protein
MKTNKNYYVKRSHKRVELIFVLFSHFQQEYPWDLSNPFQKRGLFPKISIILILFHICQINNYNYDSVKSWTGAYCVQKVKKNLYSMILCHFISTLTEFEFLVICNPCVLYWIVFLWFFFLGWLDLVGIETIDIYLDFNFGIQVETIFYTLKLRLKFQIIRWNSQIIKLS